MNNHQILRRYGWFWLVVSATAVVGLTWPIESAAQRPNTPAGKKGAADEKPEAKKNANPGKKDAPPQDPSKKGEPQAVDLETDDGVLISGVYFPSTLGKNAPAVILLHGLNERQRVFTPTETGEDLAFALQERGYAVLTFDLRGHGLSKGLVAGGRKIDVKDFRTPQDYATMTADVEAAKRFLVRRNNAGELNVSKLGVVGCELGASIGVLWSFRDWSVPAQVAFGSKQGQDVQALVLISPTLNYKGLTITRQLALLQKEIPIQVIVGKKDDKVHSEAVKIADAARKARPGAEVPSQRLELDTKLQGSKLLNPDHELGVHKSIVQFLDAALKAKVAKWEPRDVSDSEPTAK
ncbi:MAG: alpha/beta hydrolase [Planctomycetes bacterium]|nr:alpha/beta hydrolase [Planctomycetota bacterium]